MSDFTPIGKSFTMKAKNGKMVEYKIFDQDIMGIYYQNAKNPYNGNTMSNKSFLALIESGQAIFNVGVCDESL